MTSSVLSPLFAGLTGTASYPLRGRQYRTAVLRHQLPVMECGLSTVLIHLEHNVLCNCNLLSHIYNFDLTHST